MITRYVYKTTCVVTNQFYVGMRSTRHPNRPYYGSGIRIKRSVAKHGRSNHVVEVIAYATSEDELRKLEHEHVAAHLTNPLCLNLMEGGRGGFTADAQRTSRRSFKQRIDEDAEYRQRISKQNSDRAKLVTQQGRNNCSAALRERYKDPEFKRTQKIAAQAANQRSHEQRQEKLSQGWVWMRDPLNNKRRKLTPPDNINLLSAQGWINVSEVK